MFSWGAAPGWYGSGLQPLTPDRMPPGRCPRPVWSGPLAPKDPSAAPTARHVVAPVGVSILHYFPPISADCSRRRFSVNQAPLFEHFGCIGVLSAILRKKVETKRGFGAFFHRGRPGLIVTSVRHFPQQSL
jgi:hypothetical protein